MAGKYKIIITVLTALIITLTIFFLFLSYLNGALEMFGLCKPGQEISRNGRGGHFCYTPSGHAGQSCNNKTDCGTGSCVLSKNWENFKGQCVDGGIYDCAITIDEAGNQSEPNCGF